MNIRLIALDLDGTLLDSQKRLSERNRNTLLECIRKGIHVVPTTGRSADGIPDEVRLIPGIRYAITTNGAMIEDLAEKKIIDERKLNNSLVIKVIKMVESYHVMYDPYIEGRGITENRFYNHLDDYGVDPIVQDLIRKTRDVVPNIMQYVMESGKDAEKVNLFFADEETRKTVRAVLENESEIIITSSMPNNLEINAVGASKGSGILRLAEYLGLLQEQTMAVGDGENDYTMIEMAGFGVAMENGESYLKSIASYVTCTNDEDGVAAAIEEFVLKRL